MTDVIKAYRGDEPMNGDDIDNFMELVRIEVRHHEGDITDKQYATEHTIWCAFNGNKWGFESKLEE